MDPQIRARIYCFLAEKGLRRTAQRDAIIEAALGTEMHFTAEDLLAMAKAIEKSVSRATIYRTLPLLVECGVLREMDFGKDQMHYDPNFNRHPHHHHVICVDCDRIIEFEDLNIETLENCITKRLGFSPASKIVRIEATCDELKLMGECKNRPKPRQERAAAFPPRT
jgi:Fur family ferric uptake transcriptional regulator